MESTPTTTGHQDTYYGLGVWPNNSPQAKALLRYAAMKALSALANDPDAFSRRDAIDTNTLTAAANAFVIADAM